ncbi:MAG: hypothetical protein B6243_11610 [Anaerolineaceae bacterium 4572_5.2]|nr:MAG: hypothetical protein B6243_11610 [Anaerolineaceae bacterium 4572_5.2]
MPKTFYTERDIEDFARQGVRSLDVDEDVVLTDLARDKARRLGIELVRPHDKPPAAPERPYIATPSPSASSPSPEPASKRIAPTQPSTAQASVPKLTTSANGDDLYNRVRDAVVARLGDTVDAQLLETIIKRVLQNVSTK